MKKKIFLIIGSLGAGGSERVFWLLSQYFNDREYEVSVIILNSNEQCFSTDIKGIRFIDLKTIKTSRSFFKLYRLLKVEKPFAVFSTTDNINILTAMVGCFLKVPHLIGRASNNPQEMKQFYRFKDRFYNLFTRVFFFRFDFIVCQSTEMRQSLAELYGINLRKLKVISNPVLPTALIRNDQMAKAKKRLIGVGRLIKGKGWFRLLDIMTQLPENYVLTIIGDGPLMNQLKQYIIENNLDTRVTLLGERNDVSDQIINYDLFVLSSFSEGFPNVVLEALSVGVPVVAFKVGGLQDVIRNGFNGFLAEQGDNLQMQRYIETACSMSWRHQHIKEDTTRRFNLTTIGQAYESLLQTN